jgi:hypothetical protein
MYYIIDACEYCDEFKRVSFEDVNKLNNDEIGLKIEVVSYGSA